MVRADSTGTERADSTGNERADSTGSSLEYLYLFVIVYQSRHVERCPCAYGFLKVWAYC